MTSTEKGMALAFAVLIVVGAWLSRADGTSGVGCIIEWDAFTNPTVCGVSK